MRFNIQETDTTIMLDQNDYIGNLTPESLPASHISQKIDSLTPEEYTVSSWLSQLGSSRNTTRLGI